MGRLIQIGPAATITPGRTVDLILRPGEPVPPEQPGLTVHHCQDINAARLALRDVFADHMAICTLGGAEVAGDPAWCPAIEARLAELLEDLGNCPLDSWAGALNAIRNGPALSRSINSGSLIGALKGRSAICLGAGPSATPEILREIGRLSRNHVIFCADSMLGACKNAGFSPHFVTMIERPEAMSRFVLGASPDSTLIAPPVVDPKCVSAFTRTCFWWAGDLLYRWLAPEIPPIGCGRSAGTLSVAAAILSGCSVVYLVGHDLAYADGRVGHCPGAHPLAADTQREDDQKADNGRYGLAQFEVPSYSGCPVRTNGLWNLFRADIEALVAATPECRVFNAGGYRGAEIAGVPVCCLPEFGPLERVPAVPELRPVPVVDPQTRCAGILTDLVNLAGAGIKASAALTANPPPELDELAATMAIGRMVSRENADLFRYVLRSVTSSLSLRLHMRAEMEHDAKALQKDCLAILARTLPPMCARMYKDLFECR